MKDFSILEIATVLNPPIKLSEIIYNCPVCDFEIDIDEIVEDDITFDCENCQHKVVIKIKNIL